MKRILMLVSIALLLSRADQSFAAAPREQSEQNVTASEAADSIVKYEESSADESNWDGRPFWLDLLPECSEESRIRPRLFAQWPERYFCFRQGHWFWTE